MLCPVRRRRSPALPLALVLFVACAGPAAAQTFGAVAGRVRDASTGRPVAGIEVLVLGYGSNGPPAGRATTDADGRYRIGGLRADPGLDRYVALIEHATDGYLGQLYDRVPCWGSYQVEEWHAGILLYSCGGVAVQPTEVEVRAGRTVRAIDFELAGRVGSIAGTVTAAATGESVAGVEIELRPSQGSGAETVTDAAGRYGFGDLPPGDYRLVASPISGFVREVYPDAHCPYYECFEIEGEPVPLAAGEHLEGIDFALDALGGIAGRITDAGTGEPLPGLKVFAYGPVPGPSQAVYSAGVSDADGVYRLADLAPGDYSVLAGDEDGPYVDQAWNGLPCVGLEPLPCGTRDPVPVEVGATTPDIDFELEIGGAIAGRMTGDGEPLAEIELWVRESDEGLRVVANPVTDGDGFYVVEGLPLGSYTLESRGAAERSFVDELYDGLPCVPGYCPRGEGTAIEVAPGDRIDGVDFSLERFGAIAGTLTTATGTAILNARLGIWRRGSVFVDHAGPTDSAGRFTSPPLPRGVYYVGTTFFDSRWANELYDDVLCPQGVGLTCDAEQGTAVLVRSGEITDGIDLEVGPAAGFTCTPSATVACLGEGRFWASVRGPGGMARPWPLADGTAAFTFSDPRNPEVALRVIDACEPFDGVWVFTAGLTRRALYATVIDTVSGESWAYFHQSGSPVPALLDTQGLAVCDVEPPGGGLAAIVGGTDAVDPEPGISGPAVEASVGPCVPAPDRLCLHDGRFSVEVDWESISGAAGAAHAVPLSSTSGWFWFRRRQAPELLVKVLDLCADDPPVYRVFAGGLTNSAVQLRVTDLVARESRDYANPLGRSFVPIVDLAAFATCP